MNQTVREQAFEEFKKTACWLLAKDAIERMHIKVAFEQGLKISNKQLEELRAELEKEKGKLTVIEVKYATENAELKGELEKTKADLESIKNLWDDSVGREIKLRENVIELKTAKEDLLKVLKKTHGNLEQHESYQLDIASEVRKTIKKYQ